MKKRPQGRRAVPLMAAALAFGLTSACGGGGGSGDGGSGDVVLRLTWWGSDTRHQLTEQAVAAFEEEHPGIDVQVEYTEWGGYWDRLATTVAANDAPDVIQMDEAFLNEYAGRGALLDLTGVSGLDTSEIAESTLATGQADGGQYAIPAGINTYALLANPEIFAAAGVDMPDDTTWTWDDYLRIATEITEATDEGVWGAQSFGNEQAAFTVWARQHGESLFTADGQPGFTEATAASFFEYVLQMRDANGVPPASVTTEELTAGLEQGVLATSRVAMGQMWSNQLFAASEATGTELVLLRMPSASGSSAANGSYFKSSMYWSVSERSEHPEEAAMLVDFLVNSPTAAEILLAERGVPPNEAVRSQIVDQLDASQTAALDFVEAIGDDIVDAPAPPPVGGASVQEIFQRYSSEVLFDRLSPAEAAAGFLDELTTAIA